MMRPNLYLHEEILLLAMRDEEGTFVSDNLRFALGGAVLAELLLGGRVEVEQVKRRWSKQRMVNLTSEERFGDPVLDTGLERIAGAGRRGTVETWVKRIAGLKRLRHQVAEGLCRRGILRVDEGLVLLLFRRKIYPERDPRPEKRVLERLRRAIFSDWGTVDPRTAVLLSLADSVGLLRHSFDRRRLKSRKGRIERITSGELMGRTTREVVVAVQAAQIAAAAAAVVVVTSSN